jgi:hypothetical protein
MQSTNSEPREQSPLGVGDHAQHDRPSGTAGSQTERPAETPNDAAAPGTDVETWAQERLNTLVAGQTDAFACAFADGFVRALADFDDAVPPDFIVALVARLRDRFKVCGYKPAQAHYYLRKYRDAAGRSGSGGDAGAAEATYRAVVPEPGTADATDRIGLYRVGDGRGNDTRLSNCVVIIDEDVVVADALARTRTFRGRAVTKDGESKIEIAADDFARDQPLVAAIYQAAGPQVQVICRTPELRNAISALSRSPRRRVVTRDIGWDPTGTTYRTPTAVVSAEGVREAGDDDDVRVDLDGDERPRHLGLTVIPADRLAEVKRHVVTDLLAVHDRRVTRTLLAAIALAVLLRFSGVGKPALWLVGLTGSGKTFLARLFSAFFGHLPEGVGLASWASTINFLEFWGHHHRDALFIVDDYKPDLTMRWAVIRLLQTYHDGTGRGRLQRDATANVTRPIRGLLLATGEDVPDHSASALARSIVIDVPERPRVLDRGLRCIAMSPYYAGLTADFIQWLLAGGHTARFAELVAGHRARFLADIAGRPNDIRVAGNVALFAAAGELMFGYLSEVWPEARNEFEEFISADLVALRDRVVQDSHDEQDYRILLRLLSDRLALGRVQIKGLSCAQIDKDRVPVIGEACGIATTPGSAVGARQWYVLRMSACLAEVNQYLTEQRRPTIAATDKTLLRQLREAGLLVDEEGRPVPPGPGTNTRRHRDGQEVYRVFRLAASALDLGVRAG